MVRDLICGFVHEPWVAQIDFSTLEKMPDNFRRSSTSFATTFIYRVKFGGSVLYIYIILEFQSENDRMMAARVLNYTGQFYLSLVRQKVEFGDLVEAAPVGLEHYQPKLRYLLIDEGTVDESRSLAERNLVAALFRLEKSREPKDVGAVLELLLEWFKDAWQNELCDAFAVWVRQVLIPGRMPEGEFPETTNLSLKETKNMLAETVKEWTQQWKQEGLARLPLFLASVCVSR